jgi:hypothetical protein
MRYLVLVAIAVALAAMPGHAQAAKKLQKPYNVYDSRAAVQIYPDASGGNAAAGGNNANSMSGSNSAINNANGRTSGGRN